ncbi:MULTISPECIES: serine hydrolase [unclassified Paenibacillus]|uniref:serine hydrolase domain-containing protein n=1 Tax=unclassified Paenibacillus TaxID=185978 RepID=UPI0024056596|nr:MULTISPECIES: serine hydrolase [unclassified Paenibacillus]MDF9844795.1 CubicO group peptidase (beta-lactamase class C family) [Paenibacillus sp. PastF-2]MDF9851404.1 CubicO group peptidase (beta-lactamase class C family) [Paenibacillus sp. PastM-2]MDF9857979.1 CubicO group peptidase (beta-lactamase class C family) [Paenibacillus sp. PastF-1]MDH6483247.1 CubicO group peptidase (beta-lactamase class C family) [Paenibacillus sp. PastH-2]MDH6510657.1 CubicO group peptidase (beta-lactamase clas
MDTSKLSAALAPYQLRSCLISSEGRLVFEHYRETGTDGELAKINSCTKSILSALVCIAMQKGLLPQPETLLAEFYPRLRQDRDPRKAAITLEHLLTMSPGFNWTEFGGQNSFPRMTRSENWIDYVLEQPLSHNPGEHMEYNSGVSQLLAALLAEGTEMPVARFAESVLFSPLGIEQYEWEQDPQGIHTGGFGLRLRPVHLLRFGQLYLQRGQWDHRQLIASELVDRSTQTALLAEAPRRGGYAWHWWTDSYTQSVDTAAESELHYFYARGYGGQFIYVLPKLETVVVLTQDNRGKQKRAADVFRESVLPILTAT